MPGSLAALVLVLFLIGWVLLWLGVTSLLGLVSGWYRLMRRYPDQDERALVKLAGQSGYMGGVNLRGVLSFAACPSGLRVAIWRGMGPFSKPFFVPWDEIAAEPKKALLGELRKLRFGKPCIAAMVVDRRTWERLSKKAA